MNPPLTGTRPSNHAKDRAASVSADSGRIRTLDGVRGIAIGLVLLGHIAQNCAGIPDPVRVWTMAFANSSAGVRLFFVLSGYLITGLLLREHARTGTISLRQFYWRRVLRIFPAFYLFLAVALLWQHERGQGVSAAAAASTGTFTWNYRFLWPAPDSPWILGHLWTLALEQQFYLFWPVVLLLAGPRRAVWVAFALLVWCPIARVGAYFLFPAQRGFTGMMLHTAIDSIMAGCLGALLCHRPAVKAWLARQSPGWLAAGFAWLLLVSPVLATTLRGEPTAIGFTLDAVAATSVIALLHQGRRTLAHALLGRGFLPVLGLISYSLYLWQQPFLAPQSFATATEVIVRITGACVVATGSYFLVEKPFLRLKRRLKPQTANP